MVTLRPSRQLILELAADFRALSRLRDQLRAWLADIDISSNVLDDVLLVATELCTNAIEATANGEPVEVRATTDGRSLRLSVANVAPRPAREATVLPHGTLRERGRGLAIVRSLVDTLVMTTQGGRTVVRTMQLL